MCHFYLLKEHPLQFIGFGPFPFPLGQLGDIHHDILATQKAGTALYTTKPKTTTQKYGR
jgi:hypothetical protein